MEDALEKFLAPYFSSQEAAKIQRQLEKVLTLILMPLAAKLQGFKLTRYTLLLLLLLLQAQIDFVSSLNLEDVNELCAQFVATK